MKISLITAEYLSHESKFNTVFNFSFNEMRVISKISIGSCLEMGVEEVIYKAFPSEG
jgi:hypothetical protein